MPGALAIHVTVKSVGACKTIKLAYTIFYNTRQEGKPSIHK